MRPRPPRVGLPSAPPLPHALWVALTIVLALGAARGQTDAQAQAAGQPSYRVIVNPSNADTSVERTFLAHAFLKKATTWSDGETIHPVDQLANSAVRRQFSEEILERPVSAVRSYWQQLIFSGRGVPPPELDNDDAVVRYVSRHAGAVGYVSGGADLRGTKVLVVR
jgi:ABC-type phosphate transport system substrate-binding protein